MHQMHQTKIQRKGKQNFKPELILPLPSLSFIGFFAVPWGFPRRFPARPPQGGIGSKSRRRTRAPSGSRSRRAG